MVSETVDMLPAKTVTVYYNSTMNETHKRHIKNEFNEGRVSIIDENMHLHLPNNTRAKYYSASENIAKGYILYGILVQLLSQRLLNRPVCSNDLKNGI